MKIFLWSVTGLVASLAMLVEWQHAPASIAAREPNRGTAPAAGPAAIERATPSSAGARDRAAGASCPPEGRWSEYRASLPFVAWRKLVVRDYSGAASQGCFPVASPETAADVQKLVRLAAQLQAPIRIRGAGHSMNVSSLPGPDELLLSTARLTELRFERRGTVVAQAGLRMHAVEAQVRAYGLHVPVVNDGPPAPTVGGYVSAGGLGVGSMEYGGFWDNVAALTVVDGRGELRRVTRRDPDFLWFFGAMGQLGIVVEAELDVVAAAVAAASAGDPYLERKRVRLPSEPLPNPSRTAPLVWFTLLLGPDQLAQGRAELQALQARFSDRLEMLQPYTYPFRDRGRAPPLFFGKPGPLTALGIWAKASDEQAARELDRAFAALCERHGFRRYIQTELTRGPDAYRRYFGADLYERFGARKQRLDPLSIFNRGSVFDSSEVASTTAPRAARGCP